LEPYGEAMVLLFSDEPPLDQRQQIHNYAGRNEEKINFSRDPNMLTFPQTQ
jgi:hypothetical protein